MGIRFTPIGNSQDPERTPESTSEYEIEDALTRAEALLDRVDEADVRLTKLNAIVAILGTVSLALGIVLAVVSVSGVDRLVLLVAMCAVAGSVVLVGHLATKNLRSIRDRDERAMIDIVDLLREVLPFAIERENWSITRDQVIRTRIARFPISVRGDQ